MIMSRYANPCPVCGAIILPSDIHLYGDSFLCPTCGNWLKYKSNYTKAICAVSILVATSLTWRMGYRDTAFIFIAIAATIFLAISGVFLEGFLVSPAYKQVQGKPFDGTVSLHLTDKPDGGKKTIP